MNCGCPRGASLQTIPVHDCPESMGQVQKLIFQRIYKSGDELNSIADPTKLASWTPLLTASDGTKAVITPFISEPTAEPGEARTYGGGNATVGGVEIILGTNPTAFTAKILRSPQDTIKAMKELMCEDVGVYLVDGHGNIGCIKKSTSGGSPTTAYYPIPVQSVFVSDKGLGGFEAPDSNNISFSFLPGWSDDFAIVTPSDFNPLRDLVAAAE